MTLGTPIFVKIMTKNAMTPSSGEPKVPYIEESFLLVPRARYMYTCIQTYGMVLSKDLNIQSLKLCIRICIHVLMIYVYIM